MSAAFVKSVTLRLGVGGAALISILFSAALSYGQASDQSRGPAAISSAKNVESPKASGPKFTEYRGVRIGMTTDDARRKLGKPEEKDKTQDVFVFSNNETAQIFYDEEQKVYAISIDFSEKGSAAPSAIEILGREIPAKADGSIYQLQQYREAGYWVSYNRTAGDMPRITVTMQRISGRSNE